VWLIHVDKIHHTFVSFDVHTTRRSSFIFKACLVFFFAWLADMFNNFELMQNREKTRNDLIYTLAYHYIKR
jgi:hypothetical protein